MDTLDHYFAGNSGTMRMIKIDVEGYEFFVLKGCLNLLQRCRPHILCEVFPRAYPLLGHSLKDLLDLMQGLNYSTRTVDGQPVQLETLEQITEVHFPLD